MDTIKKHFWGYLGLIVLTSLGIELVVRPLFPELVRGESVMTELVRLIPSVIAGMGL